jgi:hypothetical protein
MGDHYVPQYYLKGFSGEDGKTVWVYDKSNRSKFATQVKSIANETRFYSPEIESYLADHVEGPANPVLDRIRGRVQISPEDKQILSAYMVCMMIRVPQGKERIKLLAPSVAEEVRKEVDRQLSATLPDEPEKAESIERRRSEAHGIIDKWAKDPPDELWLRTIPAEKWQRALGTLNRMNWRFLTFDHYPAFLASDNPLFYFPSIGFGRPESEVTFPLSSHVALWATWQTDVTEGFFETSAQVVKELNRRTASSSTRYVFHSVDEKWVLKLATQHSWRLNMLK